MNRPPKNADRDRYYFVVPHSGERSGVAGEYVGECGDYVVLMFDAASPARGFPWREVEPVEIKPVLKPEPGAA